MRPQNAYRDTAIQIVKRGTRRLTVAMYQDVSLIYRVCKLKLDAKCRYTHVSATIYNPRIGHCQLLPGNVSKSYPAKVYTPTVIACVSLSTTESSTVQQKHGEGCTVQIERCLLYGGQGDEANTPRIKQIESCRQTPRESRDVTTPKKLNLYKQLTHDCSIDNLPHDYPAYFIFYDKHSLPKHLSFSVPAIHMFIKYIP